MTASRHITDTKRVQVSFTRRQWNLIDKLRGEMGSTDAELVRNIVITWLSEKSLISDVVKREKIKLNNSFTKRNTSE